jgi:uncharacterized membrane protein
MVHERNAVSTFWPLILAILIGAALRGYRLGADSLWVDEFATLDLATRSPADIVRLSSTINFISPLYFLLVHWTMKTLGESEVALRLPSVVAGVCTIPVTWLLIKEITQSRSTANIAAALLAVNPLHLWYSQEGRPYALLLFFGCCALLFLERAARTGSWRDWILFSICTALAFLTHTTGVLLGLIAWTWVLWSPARRHLVRPLVIASLIVGLICTPFVIAIARALNATHGTFHSEPRALTGLEIPYTLLTYVGGYSFGPAPREIQNFGPAAALTSHPFESVMAGVVLLGILILSGLQRRRAMMPFLLLFGISLGGIFVLSALSGKAYNVRYTLPALVGFLGIVSIAVRGLKPRPRALCLTGLVALALWADGQRFYWPGYWKEDSRAAVAWLRAELAPGATVAVAPSYSITPLEYYSRQAAVRISFVPAATGSDSAAPVIPDALVLTRLHHVPDWRELKARFVEESGTAVLRGEVPGYEMLIRRRR